MLKNRQVKSCEQLEGALSIAYLSARKKWGEERDEILTLLEKDKGLNRGIYSKRNVPVG